MTVHSLADHRRGPRCPNWCSGQHPDVDVAGALICEQVLLRQPAHHGGELLVQISMAQPLDRSPLELTVTVEATGATLAELDAVLEAAGRARVLAAETKR